MKNRIDSFNRDYAFLSNFYESSIEFEGIKYPTVEHYFQAMKTLNLQERKNIADAPTPGKAKQFGRSVWLRADWENIKDDVMLTGLRLKFQIPEFRTELLNTGDAQLIEGNFWHDNTWGDCVCNKCSDKPGENRLGKLLMKVREEIGREK